MKINLITMTKTSLFVNINTYSIIQFYKQLFNLKTVYKFFFNDKDNKIEGLEINKHIFT